MAQNTKLSTYGGTLLLALLSGCGGSSSNDDAPVIRDADPPSNFPSYTLTFPAELDLTLARSIDINSDDSQVIFRAGIFANEDQQTFELLCQVEVQVSDIDSAEQAYLPLIESEFVSIISTDPIQNGLRSGIEILYTDILNDGTALTGLAQAYYFNANAENLVRSSTHIFECLGSTQTFNNRRSLIDQFLDSVQFGTDATNRNEMNFHTISETGYTATMSEY